MKLGIPKNLIDWEINDDILKFNLNSMTFVEPLFFEKNSLDGKVSF